MIQTNNKKTRIRNKKRNILIDKIIDSEVFWKRAEGSDDPDVVRLCEIIHRFKSYRRRYHLLYNMAFNRSKWKDQVRFKYVPSVNHKRAHSKAKEKMVNFYEHDLNTRENQCLYEAQFNGYLEDTNRVHVQDASVIIFEPDQKHLDMLKTMARIDELSREVRHKIEELEYKLYLMIVGDEKNKNICLDVLRKYHKCV